MLIWHFARPLYTCLYPWTFTIPGSCLRKHARSCTRWALKLFCELSALGFVTTLSRRAQCSVHVLFCPPSQPSFLPPPIFTLTTTSHPYSHLIHKLQACPLTLHNLPMFHSGFTSLSFKHYKVIALIPHHICPSAGTALKTYSRISWPFTFSTLRLHRTSIVQLILVIHGIYILQSLWENRISK